MNVAPYASTLKLMRLLQSGTRTEELMTLPAREGDNAHLLMRMALLFNIYGKTGQAWELQHEALQLRRHYSMAADRTPAAIRLLLILKAGFMLDNTPVDFLIEGMDVACELLYVTPDQPLPTALPEHDVAFVALGHFARNASLIERIRPMLEGSGKPVLNMPRPEFSFERDALNQLLQGIPGLVVPPTRTISRNALRNLALDGDALPLIVRPLRSQAGKGLQRLLHGSDIDAYLSAQAEALFYVAPYVDYRSPDGLYRKCRLLLLRGVPWVCHLAISSHWVVHYQSAGMEDSAAKREEEERFMAGSEQGFCRRHGAALKEIAARIGIDYVVIDCAETQDGQLLFFEADNVSIIHATDPLDMFPYKQVQMSKVFDAFRALLDSVTSA